MSPKAPAPGRGQGIVREAVRAGPRLIARSPLAFLAWAVLRMATLYVPLTILLAAHQSVVGSVWAILAALPFETVLTAALLRAALRPEASAWAFMRLGKVELRMAGLLILGGMVGLLVAVPVLTAVAYLALGLGQFWLARAASVIGLMAAALVLIRFAPALAILVDEARVDLGAAWRASRGRYWLLAVVVLAAAAIERGLGGFGAQLIAPTNMNSWPVLFSLPLLAGVAWRSLVGAACLAVMAGAVAVVWRWSKQTLD